MTVKITFDLKNGQIVVEGGEGNLLKLAEQAKAIAPAFSEIRIINEQVQSKASIAASNPTWAESRAVSLRDFAKPLNLTNIYERIAAIAYHAIKIQGRATFSVKEMGDWFGLCGFKKPSSMPTAFSDAKRKYGYVESKGRDQWTIATGGENIIMGLLESKS